MNKSEKEAFADRLLTFIRLSREKLVKPYEGAGHGILSPLQFYSLIEISGQESTMGELAEKMQMPKQHVTKIVGRLVELGLAERKDDPADRRMVRVAATEEARRFFREQVRENTEKLLSRIETLPREDLEAFAESMETLNAILEKIPGGPDGR